VIDTRSPEARERLAAALAVQRWVDEVAAGGPYLSDAELDEAVALHPRIGEQGSPDGVAGHLSAGEQAGLGASHEGVDAAIARGNAVYEGRFGRTFLIRAAGRSRQEVLDELQRRLKNDDATEAEEAKGELRQIAALRLATLFGDEA
jgi:2-oxo-4-hydroxy-4-carboxy-5-ureidoimidazoline decarboxylase